MSSPKRSQEDIKEGVRSVMAHHLMVRYAVTSVKIVVDVSTVEYVVTSHLRFNTMRILNGVARLVSLGSMMMSSLSGQQLLTIVRLGPG